MKSYLKDQFPADSLNEDEDAESEQSGENKEAEYDQHRNSLGRKGIDLPIHVSLRQMYHIFDYFTQESFFGKQVKDIRSELDQAKRDISFGNMNHDEFKDECDKVFKQ